MSIWHSSFSVCFLGLVIVFSNFDEIMDLNNKLRKIITLWVNDSTARGFMTYLLFFHILCYFINDLDKYGINCFVIWTVCIVFSTMSLMLKHYSFAGCLRSETMKDRVITMGTVSPTWEGLLVWATMMKIIIKVEQNQETGTQGPIQETHTQKAQTGKIFYIFVN